MTLFLFTVLALHAAFGLGVLATNPTRHINQCFAIVVGVIGTWLFSMDCAFKSIDSDSARFWIAQSFAIGAFVPTAFQLLFTAVIEREASWPRLLRKCRIFVFSAAAFYLLSHTPWIIAGADMGQVANGTGIPEPIKGQAFLLYLLYVGIAYLWIGVNAVRYMITHKGLARLELEFIMAGCLIGGIFGVFFSTLLPLLMGNSQAARYSTAGVLLVDLIIGYGIATQHILDVRSLLRRVVAYALVILQLAVVYGSVFFLCSPLLPFTLFGSLQPAALIAAIVAALTMAPSRGVLQQFTNRLFLNIHQVNLEETLKRANLLFRSIQTTPDLLNQFASLLKEAIGTDEIVILLRDNNTYRQAYPMVDSPIRISTSHALSRLLSETGVPVSDDALMRRNNLRDNRDALALLKRHHAKVAVGISAKREVNGLVLLGARLSGMIYNSQDLNALQIACQQLGTAMESAGLYTQVKNSQIYNETLLDQLVSGVLAADSSGDISVCNREARRLLDIESGGIIGRPLSALPRVLSSALEQALHHGETVRDVTTHLDLPQNEAIPISLSTRIILGAESEPMGVLLVFQDLTRIKALEEKVRRSDRLATLGALSASVAHEVKNPLVAIKTFVQLLPERQKDTEFLSSFSTLIAGEVQRIDRIINQLLMMGRNEKTNAMSPVQIHPLLENAVMLMQHNFAKNHVSLSLKLEARENTVMADPQKLQQVFLNILMNALEAMPKGGSLCIRTRLEKTADSAGSSPLEKETSGFRLFVTFQDTGTGISPEAKARIFDPFFTTKDTGTGLGLSISRNILREHGGNIDIGDNNEKGSEVSVDLPLKPSLTFA
jgi:signal transduction histidine kinase